jgi:hypothetical protein
VALKALDCAIQVQRNSSAGADVFEALDRMLNSPSAAVAAPAAAAAVTAAVAAPAAPAAPAVADVAPEGGGSGSGRDEGFEARLTDFYALHNPAKLSSVAEAAVQWAGKEARCFALLQQKYDVAAPPPAVGLSGKLIAGGADTGAGASALSASEVTANITGEIISTYPDELRSLFTSSTGVAAAADADGGGGDTAAVPNHDDAPDAAEVTDQRPDRGSAAVAVQL